MNYSDFRKECEKITKQYEPEGFKFAYNEYSTAYNTGDDFSFNVKCEYYRKLRLDVVNVLEGKDNWHSSCGSVRCDFNSKTSKIHKAINKLKGLEQSIKDLMDEHKEPVEIPGWFGGIIRTIQKIIGDMDIDYTMDLYTEVEKVWIETYNKNYRKYFEKDYIDSLAKQAFMKNEFKVPEFDKIQASLKKCIGDVKTAVKAYLETIKEKQENEIDAMEDNDAGEVYELFFTEHEVNAIQRALEFCSDGFDDDFRNRCKIALRKMEEQLA